MDNMKYGIYYNDLRVWGRFNSYEQATNFIETYDLEQNYIIKSYQIQVLKNNLKRIMKYRELRPKSSR